ncbi:hypothetical protein N7456_000208 [Penicillium angulare]|uniref:Uncharacterized protein n=1 Tax=Penicillium angulare TaxID=116970 RepID=A0A9W9GC07_9EURO|nr:hypothetical protein N7456_000208 [Penicillium angulare]
MDAIVNLATNTNTNSTQPDYCYYSRDSFPSLPDTPKYYAEVPLYQTVKPSDNMSEILQSCCHSEVWLYSDPRPCTAVCNSTSEKQAQDVAYCLNEKGIDYGGHLKDSAGARVTVPMGICTTLLVGGLVFSGMFL